MKKSKRLLAPALIALLALSASTARLTAEARLSAEDDYAGEPESGRTHFSRPDHADGAWGHRGPRRGEGPMGAGGPGGLMMALRDLDLSESQRAEIKTVVDQDRAEAEAHREAMRGLGANLEAQIESDPFDEEAVRTKAAAVASQGVEMAVLRARQMGQIRNLLTPAQLDQLELMKQERESFREQRRERFERHRGPRSGSG